MARKTQQQRVFEKILDYIASKYCMCEEDLCDLRISDEENGTTLSVTLYHVRQMCEGVNFTRSQREDIQTAYDALVSYYACWDEAPKVF